MNARLFSFLIATSTLISSASAWVGGPFSGNTFSSDGSFFNGTYQATMNGTNLTGVMIFGISSSGTLSNTPVGLHDVTSNEGRFAAFVNGTVVIGTATGSVDTIGRKVAVVLEGSRNRGNLSVTRDTKTDTSTETTGTNFIITSSTNYVDTVIGGTTVITSSTVPAYTVVTSTNYVPLITGSTVIVSSGSSVITTTTNALVTETGTTFVVTTGTTIVSSTNYIPIITGSTAVITSTTTGSTITVVSSTNFIPIYSGSTAVVTSTTTAQPFVSGTVVTSSTASRVFVLNDILHLDGYFNARLKSYPGQTFAGGGMVQVEDPTGDIEIISGTTGPVITGTNSTQTITFTRAVPVYAPNANISIRVYGVRTSSTAPVFGTPATVGYPTVN